MNFVVINRLHKHNSFMSSRLSLQFIKSKRSGLVSEVGLDQQTSIYKYPKIGLHDFLSFLTKQVRKYTK